GERGLLPALDRLARPPRRSTQSLERFQIVRIDGPHEPQLGSVQPLPQKQAAHVRLRRVELGGSFGDGEYAGAFDPRILARARNHFWYSDVRYWTEARVLVA